MPPSSVPTPHPVQQPFVEELRRERLTEGGHLWGQNKLAVGLGVCHPCSSFGCYGHTEQALFAPGSSKPSFVPGMWSLSRGLRGQRNLLDNRAILLQKACSTLEGGPRLTDCWLPSTSSMWKVPCSQGDMESSALCSARALLGQVTVQGTAAACPRLADGASISQIYWGQDGRSQLS